MLCRTRVSLSVASTSTHTKRFCSQPNIVPPPKRVFLVNGHAAWENINTGSLNKSVLGLARQHFLSLGCEIKDTIIDSAEAYCVRDEIAKYQWADLIFFQCPMYWFNVPWQFKKYIDEIYTEGMDGSMCKGDGRSRKTGPTANFGTGGRLHGHYMLSVTTNTPKAAFRRTDSILCGKSLDDLYLDFHMTQRFCNLKQVPDSTFAIYDVKKNPDIENEMLNFSAHLGKLFPQADGNS